jgi:hypothetical protein
LELGFLSAFLPLVCWTTLTKQNEKISPFHNVIPTPWQSIPGLMWHSASMFANTGQELWMTLLIVVLCRLLSAASRDVQYISRKCSNHGSAPHVRVSLLEAPSIFVHFSRERSANSPISFPSTRFLPQMNAATRLDHAVQQHQRLVLGNQKADAWP